MLEGQAQQNGSRFHVLGCILDTHPSSLEELYVYVIILQVAVVHNTM